MTENGVNCYKPQLYRGLMVFGRRLFHRLFHSFCELRFFNRIFQPVKVFQMFFSHNVASV